MLKIACQLSGRGKPRLKVLSYRLNTIIIIIIIIVTEDRDNLLSVTVSFRLR